MAKHYGKAEIYQLLREEGIPFEALEHPPVYTMEEMDRAGISARGNVCKNLFLRDAKGRNHYLVTVPEETRVDLKALPAKIGSTKLSFASAERLERYLGVTQGCVSPFGALNDESRSVTVVFDAALQSAGPIGVHPNDNTATVWLSPADLQRVLESHGCKLLFVPFAP